MATELNAITVPNPLPPVVVALTPEAVAEVTAALTSVSDACEAGVTAETFAAASSAYERARKVAKEIEASRQAVKRPVLDLGKAIDAAAKAALAPLDDAIAKLGALLLAEQRRANAEREAAAAEVRRIEAERIATERKAQAEAAITDLFGSPTTPAAMDPHPTPAPLPVVPDKARAVVRTVKRYTVEVIDARKVPRVMHDADGNAYQLVVLDESAIKRAMIAGVDVPGCRLLVEDVTAAIGR